jgi:hypothetical protein
MGPAAIAQKTRLRSDGAFTYAALVIVAGVLATTLAQTQVLARLPLQNLLKNELQVDRTANAAFFFWAGRAWYLKPFAGVLTDAFPLFGSPTQKLHSDKCRLGGAGVVGADHNTSRLPQAAGCGDRDQRFHGRRKHGGRRLHG